MATNNSTSTNTVSCARILWGTAKSPASPSRSMIPDTLAWPIRAAIGSQPLDYYALLGLLLVEPYLVFTIVDILDMQDSVIAHKLVLIGSAK